MKDVLYFEDFTVGQVLAAGPVTVSEAEAIAFARDYDPQYFHIDKYAAENSVFKRLIVSGWQTSAITMRLKTETDLIRVAGGLIGLGLDSLKWPRPVYPGDALRISITIVEKRLSHSRPGFGVMKYRVETFNQNHELVMDMVTAVWVPCV